ncbi:MAG: aldo/keto reductase [Coprobacillaceae bacterium]
MKYITLSNGVRMPMLGYGTLQIPSLSVEKCILDALQVGYRLIDSAAMYLNEKEIGIAMKKSNIPRSELFITTKVWVQDTGYKKTMQAFKSSLKNLDLEYLDLYLLHQPYGDYYGSWKAMEELYKRGKIRAIGVCNFSAERFVDLWMNSTIKPMINQVEYHPLFQQKELGKVLKCYACQMQAWGPLNEAQRDIFNLPVLKELSIKHNKTVAQIILRWHIQNNVIAIPKTVSKERMKENIEIWDFKLDEEDMKKIITLDLGYSEIINHQSYTTAKWLNQYKIHE